MEYGIYVIRDTEAIELIEENDVSGFREYLTKDDTVIFDEPVEFETEAEALAFCAGLGYGVDERYPVEVLPLRSFEEYDKPFIELIEKY